MRGLLKNTLEFIGSGIISLVFVVSFNVFSQDPLMERAREFTNTNPDETIKISELLLKREISDKEKDPIKLLIAQSYYNKGIYDLSLEYLYNISSHLSEDIASEVLLLKADVLRELHLHKQADNYLDNLQKIIDLSESENKTTWQVCLNKIVIKGLLDQQKNYEALQLWQKTQQEYHLYIAKNPVLNQRWWLCKTTILEETKQFDSVKFYLNKIQETEKKSPNTLTKLLVHSKMSNIHFENKEYNIAIDTLLSVRSLAISFGNNFILGTIKDQLSSNYLALKEQENHSRSYNDFVFYKTKSDKTESDAVNLAYSLINQEQEDFYAVKEQEYKNYFKLSVLMLSILVLIAIGSIYKNIGQVKKYQEILKYLEASINLSIKQAAKTHTGEPKKTNIPEETEKVILTKLKKFESSSKFTNKEMSLAALATHFDTNTKYLSEVINKHYDDNFNTYINRLRINYIIEKLKTDSNYLNYKISYLADQSGFSSHSSFATVFKSLTGIAPTKFIELMQKEKENKIKQKQ